MDSRIDAIYGRQSIDKKDSISIESQFEFCRYPQSRFRHLGDKKASMTKGKTPVVHSCL